MELTTKDLRHHFGVFVPIGSKAVYFVSINGVLRTHAEGKIDVMVETPGKGFAEEKGKILLEWREIRDLLDILSAYEPTESVELAIRVEEDNQVLIASIDGLEYVFEESPSRATYRGTEKYLPPVVIEEKIEYTRELKSLLSRVETDSNVHVREDGSVVIIATGTVFLLESRKQVFSKGFPFPIPVIGLAVLRRAGEQDQISFGRSEDFAIFSYENVSVYTEANENKRCEVLLSEETIPLLEVHNAKPFLTRLKSALRDSREVEDRHALVLALEYLPSQQSAKIVDKRIKEKTGENDHHHILMRDLCRKCVEDVWEKDADDWGDPVVGIRRVFWEGEKLKMKYEELSQSSDPLSDDWELYREVQIGDQLIEAIKRSFKRSGGFTLSIDSRSRFVRIDNETLGRTIIFPN